MSRHNFNYFANQEFGHIDPRFDLGYGRFMANRGVTKEHDSERGEVRSRFERRAKVKKMKRDQRYLGD